MLLRKITINTAIIITAILSCLLLFELFLRTGILDGKDSPNPVWIPHKFTKIHEEINQQNWEVAKHNPYRFTDKVRNLKKDRGVTRIAVLGDSFVWGYGIPYKEAWGHKLDKMITDKYQNFEVMNWGMSGWSTIDELSFFEKHGIKYNIDMLIIGWVDNDADMRAFENKHYQWQKNITIKLLRRLFPNAVSFIVSYTNNFLTTYFYTDHQYQNWMKQLYSKENLTAYLEVLHDLSSYCNSKNIKLLFLLTPQRYDDIISDEFAKIIPILEEANIKYLNLLPDVKKEFGLINPRKLWANPGDGHPGTLLTDLYAKNAFNYLEKRNIFSQAKNSQISSLLEQFQRDKDNYPPLKRLLNIALHEDDWDIRKEAAVILGKINDPHTVDNLIRAIKENSPNVRAAAADALGEIDAPETVKPLIEALNDEINFVRKRAVMSLEKKITPRVIDSLISTALRDKDQYVRRHALLSLAKINNPRVVECLIQSLNDTSFHNRRTAIIALGKTMDKRAVDPLIALLHDKSKDIRAEAVEALGTINDLQTVKILQDTSLGDEDPYVRDLAADAIKKITGKEYGKYRRKLLRMWQMF
jgi:HEAT repeat protein/lysophospholipase L1-like esterase